MEKASTSLPPQERNSDKIVLTLNDDEKEERKEGKVTKSLKSLGPAKKATKHVHKKSEEIEDLKQAIYFQEFDLQKLPSDIESLRTIHPNHQEQINASHSNRKFIQGISKINQESADQKGWPSIQNSSIHVGSMYNQSYNHSMADSSIKFESQRQLKRNNVNQQIYGREFQTQQVVPDSKIKFLDPRSLYQKKKQIKREAKQLVRVPVKELFQNRNDYNNRNFKMVRTQKVKNYKSIDSTPDLDYSSFPRPHKQHSRLINSQYGGFNKYIEKLPPLKRKGGNNNNDIAAAAATQGGGDIAMRKRYDQYSAIEMDDLSQMHNQSTDEQQREPSAMTNKSIPANPPILKPDETKSNVLDGLRVRTDNSRMLRKSMRLAPLEHNSITQTANKTITVTPKDILQQPPPMQINEIVPIVVHRGSKDNGKNLQGNELALQSETGMGESKEFFFQDTSTHEISQLLLQQTNDRSAIFSKNDITTFAMEQQASANNSFQDRNKPVKEDEKELAMNLNESLKIKQASISTYNQVIMHKMNQQMERGNRDDSVHNSNQSGDCDERSPERKFKLDSPSPTRRVERMNRYLERPCRDPKMKLSKNMRMMNYPLLPAGNPARSASKRPQVSHHQNGVSVNADMMHIMREENSSKRKQSQKSLKHIPSTRLYSGAPDHKENYKSKKLLTTIQRKERGKGAGMVSGEHKVGSRPVNETLHTSPSVGLYMEEPSPLVKSNEGSNSVADIQTATVRYDNNADAPDSPLLLVEKTEENPLNSYCFEQESPGALPKLIVQDQREDPTVSQRIYMLNVQTDSKMQIYNNQTQQQQLIKETDKIVSPPNIVNSVNSPPNVVNLNQVYSGSGQNILLPLSNQQSKSNVVFPRIENFNQAMIVKVQQEECQSQAGSMDDSTAEKQQTLQITFVPRKVPLVNLTQLNSMRENSSSKEFGENTYAPLIAKKNSNNLILKQVTQRNKSKIMLNERSHPFSNSADASPIAGPSPKITSPTDLQQITTSPGINSKGSKRKNAKPNSLLNVDNETEYRHIHIQNQEFPPSPPEQSQSPQLRQNKSQKRSISKLGSYSRGRVSHLNSEREISMLHIGKSMESIQHAKVTGRVGDSKGQLKKISIANLNRQNKDIEEAVLQEQQRNSSIIRDDSRGSGIMPSQSPLKPQRNNPTQMKSVKNFKDRQKQKQQLAQKIAIKNELLQKHNYSLILQENQKMKKRNLPFTHMKYMDIIESKKDLIGLPAEPSESQNNALDSKMNFKEEEDILDSHHGSNKSYMSNKSKKSAHENEKSESPDLAMRLTARMHHEKSPYHLKKSTHGSLKQSQTSFKLTPMGIQTMTINSRKVSEQHNLIPSRVLSKKSSKYILGHEQDGAIDPHIIRQTIKPMPVDLQVKKTENENGNISHSITISGFNFDQTFNNEKDFNKGEYNMAAGQQQNDEVAGGGKRRPFVQRVRRNHLTQVANNTADAQNVTVLKPTPFDFEFSTNAYVGGEGPFLLNQMERRQDFSQYVQGSSQEKDPTETDRRSLQTVNQFPKRTFARTTRNFPLVQRARKDVFQVVGNRHGGSPKLNNQPNLQQQFSNGKEKPVSIIHQSGKDDE